MCVCVCASAAGINWKGQSTITGRRGDEGGGGGDLAEREERRKMNQGLCAQLGQIMHC